MRIQTNFKSKHFCSIGANGKAVGAVKNLNTKKHEKDTN